MNVLASVTNYMEGNRTRLQAYRLIVPDFLPSNVHTAKMMIDNLGGSFISCEDAWIVDEPTWASAEIRNCFGSMDWSKAMVLEYDWSKKWDRMDVWQSYDDESGRFRQPRANTLEPFLKKDDMVCYAELLDPDEWKSFDLDDLSRSTCWAFHFARHVCKGRLPEVLDNMMTMKSFEDPEDPWVKKYFKTKKYRIRNRKALASIPWAA